ncbi:MAG: hypothetical protein ACKOAE_09425, partial [Acidimicrobiaceae bacterium]
MAGPKGHQNMTPRVSYYPNLVRVAARSLTLALFLSFGLVPSVLTLGLTKVDTVEAKPMPAIESAWVALQAQRAVVALKSVSEISPIEQRDVASRWIKSISVIVAEHLEVD